MKETTKSFHGEWWVPAVADHDREEIILTQKYYAFGQFTRYIRPGSRLIGMNGPAVAALDGTRLTVVAVNQEDKEKTARLDVTAFGNMFPAGSRVRSIRTSGSIASGEHWAELPEQILEEGGLTVTLAPHSVTTFVIEGQE